MYNAEIALANCEYVGYHSTPNTAAKDMLIFPTRSRTTRATTRPLELFSTLEIYYSHRYLKRPTPSFGIPLKHPPD
jgi:hypothetical protein